MNIPYGYCHCGCGNKTSISDRTDVYRGYVKGSPRLFINYHRMRRESCSEELLLDKKEGERDKYDNFIDIIRNKNRGQYRKERKEYLETTAKIQEMLLASGDIGGGTN